MYAVKKVTLSTVNLIKLILGFILELIFPRNFDLDGLEKKIDDFIKSGSSSKYLDCYYFFNYKEKIIKDAVWEMKFKSDRRISVIFAGVFCYFLDNKKYCHNASNKNCDFILIPIPIHKKRRTERGFNQCEWLCEDIYKKLKNKNIKYNSKILIRNKYTEKQSWSSDKKERLEKLKGVFSVDEKFRSQILNKKIILVDDVVTTGTTIKEARRTLLESGASLVVSIVIAH